MVYERLWRSRGTRNEYKWIKRKKAKDKCNFMRKCDYFIDRNISFYGYLLYPGLLGFVYLMFKMDFMEFQYSEYQGTLRVLDGFA